MIRQHLTNWPSTILPIRAYISYVVALLCTIIILPFSIYASPLDFNKSDPPLKDQDQIAEREKDFERLRKVADDKSETPQIRTEAIIQISRIELDSASTYLFNNIELHFPRTSYRSHSDRLKEYPCYFALSIRKSVYYDLLRFLEDDLDEGQLKWIVKIFIRIKNPEEAIAMLSKYKHEVADEPKLRVLKLNLQKVIDRLEVIIDKNADLDDE